MGVCLLSNQWNNPDVLVWETSGISTERLKSLNLFIISLLLSLMGKIMKCYTNSLQGTEPRTPIERALQSFKGFIAVPFNENNVHWTLLLIHPDGKTSYIDSMKGKPSEVAGLLAQWVFLIIIITMSSYF